MGLRSGLLVRVRVRELGFYGGSSSLTRHQRFGVNEWIKPNAIEKMWQNIIKMTGCQKKKIVVHPRVWNGFRVLESSQG